MRRMRRIISPELVTFCCFSFLCARIVPRLRCWYTDLLRPRSELDRVVSWRCTAREAGERASATSGIEGGGAEREGEGDARLSTLARMRSSALHS